jgi:hypothetical protein
MNKYPCLVAQIAFYQPDGYLAFAGASTAAGTVV